MLVIFSPVKITMFKYIIILLVLGTLLYLAKDTIKERFEDTQAEDIEKIEYIRIVSKLSNKVLQPYKGSIATSLTVNTKKDDNYLPQLWISENGMLKNVENGLYLTNSNTNIKVLLAPLDKLKKGQLWTIENDGYIINGSHALQIEGGHTDDGALVIATAKSDSDGFIWTTEKVIVDVKRQVLLEGELYGKTGKDIIGMPKGTSRRFSYSLWFFANPNNNKYKNGDWMNIFNHGDKLTNFRTPGLWIIPKINKFHIRCDSSDGKNKGIDKTNFTFGFNKWYYLTIVFNYKTLQFFVNGKLYDTYTFTGMPIITSSDNNFYLNLKNGFDGKLANVEYVNKALTSGEIINRMNIRNPEKVIVDVKRQVLLEGELYGKTSKELIGMPKGTSTSFSYSLWFRANGNSYKKGEWKNIFNRGDKLTNSRHPGMWISPNKNNFHIRCDASDGTNKGIEATKFTFGFNKWYYLTIVFNYKTLQFFVDGKLSETYTFTGMPIITSSNNNFYLNLNGGFDGKLANIEYVNNVLNMNEIINRMNSTNPEKVCKENRLLTSIANNLVKGVDVWTTSGLLDVKKNEECPPQQLGGNTISAKVDSNKNGKFDTDVELLDSQYYDLSIWVKSDNVNGITIRPYSEGWNGEWKQVNKKDDWINIKWEFLNTNKASRFGIEINSKENSRVSLFLPVLSIKVLRVDDGNIEVKEYRSNGTYSTCSITDVGLNSGVGWCALKDVRDEYYIEADFDKLYHIQKIHTRGRGNYPHWTTEYRVEYFDIYYGKWTRYGAKLEANKDMNTIKTNDVDILTDKIRIYIVSYQGWPSLRLGFSGTIGIKDKCKEYKVKSETSMDIVEREKYLKLYNKECKKISYYEYQKLLDSRKMLKQKLDTKLKKAEIDAKTYESKYNEATEKLSELERKMGGEIIVSNNRNMGKVQLDESCNPIGELTTIKPPSIKKTNVCKTLKTKTRAGTMNDHQILQQLLVGMNKINADLAIKQAELVKIQKELAGLDHKVSKTPKAPITNIANQRQLNANKQQLEANKSITKNKILALKKQLNVCKANFNETKEQFEGFQGSATVTNDTSHKQNVLTCNLENLNPYDIRRHKQYKKLITDIQTKIKKTEPKCVPFSEKDISEHKDYPKVVKYIYEVAMSKMSDIKQNKDYSKLVKEVQQKTMAEYGRKTAGGYVKCPNNCELLKDINIENHPKFRKLVRKIVKDTIQKYGEAIPGTNPVLYRKCSAFAKHSVKPSATACVKPKPINKDKCISEGFTDASMDMNVLAVNAELEKLKRLQSKCIDNCNIERFEGGVTIEAYENSSSAQKIVDDINSLLLSLNTTPTDDKVNFNQIKDTCRKALAVLDQMDDTTLTFIKGVYEDILAVERGEKPLSELSSKYKTPSPSPITSDIQKTVKTSRSTPVIQKTVKISPITADIQKMVKTQVMIDNNNKGIQNEKKKLEKCKKRVVKKATLLKEKAKTCIPKPTFTPEDAKKLRNIRKDLEEQNAILKNKLMSLQHQYESSKRRIEDYEFRNKALRADLDSLRTKCNERILKLWNETKDVRAAISGREEDSRKKANELYNKQKRLEEGEQRLFDMKNSQMEKYAYYQNKINEQRSISNRYRAQLDNLKATIDKQRDSTENVKLSMDSQIAKVREECVDRVERYKKMFEEADKLLNELRHNSIEPKMIDKINNVGSSISEKVSTAVNKTKENIATVAPPSVKVKTQSDIDKQLLEDMKKLVGKVDDIEKKVNAKAAANDNDNAMWYNNKYATL